MNGSRSARCVLLLLALAAALPAQQICDGYNHQTNAGTGLVINQGTEQGMLYVVPANAPFMVDQVQLRFISGATPTGPISIAPARGTIRLETADPVTSLPSGTVLASGTFNPNNGTIISIGSTWDGPTFAPTPLPAGQLIWVIYTTAPFTGSANLGVQNGGPDIVPSTQNSGAGWGPLTLAQQFKIRFRSANCNPPGTAPTWLTIGAGCYGSNSLIPTLTPSAPPALGSTVNLSVDNGIGGADAHLFFSLGASSGGPITLPNGCPLWLEPTSFLTFVQSGANPLLQVPINSLGSAMFSISVPMDIGLIGVGIGLQAALDDPVQGFSVTECELGLIGW